MAFELTQLSDLKTVVQDPLRFKLKLNIGEDAYQSLRLKKHLLDAMDAGNGAIVGFGAAKSSLVASTFFAPSGFLGAIGVSTAATPIGWAIAAGVVGAGLSLVIGKHLVRGSSSKVRTIPDCINTPMDLLAVGLFDLMGMLSVKLALVDGEFSSVERERITSYFVDEWGFDRDFVEVGLNGLELEADNYTIRDVAEQLANFKKQNPDCNYGSMAKEIVSFLKDLSQVDGRVDEREEMAIDKVEAVFQDVSRVNLGAIVTGTASKVTGAITEVSSRTAEAVSKATGAAKSKIKREPDN